MDSANPQGFTFGGFTLDVGRRTLLDRDQRSVELSAKSFDVLVYLVQNSGRVVTRTELMDSRWPGAVVEDNALSQVVMRLRNAIGEGLVVTVTGRGYQFVEEVQVVATTDRSKQTEAEHPAAGRLRSDRLRRRYVSEVVVVLLLGFTAVGWSWFLESRSHGPVSIAVLPFENLSADPAQEYFAHGLTDTLINYLSRIEGLDVRGRTSSFYYKGRDSDLHTIGRRLNVEYILDGSVLKLEDQVRVTPQLIDSTTGSVVWSETYKDRPLADVFSIQDDIVENVARALEIKLRVGLGGWPGMTDNVEAYDAFLRGTSGMMVGGEETLRAIEHLELAVTLDESFSMAWLVLGSAYSALAEFGLSAGRDDFRRAAEAAFARARELTPGSPLVLLAEARRDADRGALRKAGAFFERLPRLVSEYGEDGFVRLETAVFLARVGRIDEATSLLEAAKRIEPLSAEIALFLGQNYAYAEDFDAALVEFDRGLQIEGSVGPLLRGAALRTALSMQDPVEISRRLAATSGDSQWAMTRLLAGFLGQPGEGLAEIRRIETTGLAEDPAALGTLAEWAAYYGDPEYSLSLLRRLPALDGSTILWINLWQPYMHNVRQVPGFKEFARELGLIDYWREYGWSNFCRGVGNDFECE